MNADGRSADASAEEATPEGGDGTEGAATAGVPGPVEASADTENGAAEGDAAEPAEAAARSGEPAMATQDGLSAGNSAEVEPEAAVESSVGRVEAPEAGPTLRMPPGVEMPKDAPVPIDPGFVVSLPDFEGPLDLLLHLIKKHELDILDLPIAFVTERYVEYVSLMEKLNLDVAAEYLVMAATLAHIKSKSLLPRAPEEDIEEDDDGMDPREELIRRLLAYQKYKRAAEELGGRGVAGRDVFPRGIPAPKAEGPAPLAEISVFKLIDIFQKILKRHDGRQAFEIDAERVTIQERIGQISELLQLRERAPFEALFEGYATTYDLVVTFLALLEMAKMRLLRVFQGEPDGPIYLEPRVLDVSDVDGVPGTFGAGVFNGGSDSDALSDDAPGAPSNSEETPSDANREPGEANAAPADREAGEAEGGADSNAPSGELIENGDGQGKDPSDG